MSTPDPSSKRKEGRKPWSLTLSSWEVVVMLILIIQEEGGRRKETMTPALVFLGGRVFPNPLIGTGKV